MGSESLSKNPSTATDGRPSAYTQNSENVKEHLRPSDPHTVCNKEVYKECEFVPSQEQLQALSAEHIANQTLTHILHSKDNGMWYLSLKFNNGSISPTTGNYDKTPDREVAIPDHPQIGYIIFKTRKLSGNFFLYC